MKEGRAASREGVRWTFVAAMLLAVLGAVFSLVGDADGAVWTTALWIVIVGGVVMLVVLVLAPHLVRRTDRDEG